MSSKGFTLVELVVVIILLGILSVFAAPRLLSSSDFEPYTVRDQLTASLRQVQMMQMQDGSHCYRLRVNDKAASPWYALQRSKLASVNGSCSGGYDTLESRVYHNLSLRLVNPVTGQGTGDDSFSMRFDSQHGWVRSPNRCRNRLCNLEITASESQRICIEAEGYIHAC